MPAKKNVYVSPSVKVFRSRTNSPKAGENNFVVGNYDGHLSTEAETIYLLDKSGDIVDSATTIPEPMGIVFSIQCSVFGIWRFRRH